MNELLLTISLVASFGAVLLALKFFGESGVYVWIALCAILANIEVAVLVHAFGMDQTLGNTLFASSFLATDILSELYGKKIATKGAAVGIFASLVFIIFTNIWIRYVPAADDWAFPHIKELFSSTPRILIASFIAYAISQFIDVTLYHAWWKFTEKKCGNAEKFLWLRNNGSTLISQAINIVLFNFGAFFGVFDFPTLVSITGSCYVIYIVTSLLDTPFVYLARKIVKRS